MNAHAKFIARTVFVKNNNVDEACRIINRFVYKIRVKIYSNQVILKSNTIFLKDYGLRGMV